MQHSTKISKNQSQSKFLGQRRKRQFLIETRKFSRQHNAAVWFVEIGSMHRCLVKTADGKNAFAWGSSSRNSFYNMLPKFELKYPSKNNLLLQYLH